MSEYDWRLVYDFGGGVQLVSNVEADSLADAFGLIYGELGHGISELVGYRPEQWEIERRSSYAEWREVKACSACGGMDPDTVRWCDVCHGEGVQP